MGLGRKAKGPTPPPVGREEGGRGLHLCHSPAVEGGVGDDGDVRGELAPDPAKRKHRETLLGTKDGHLESGLSGGDSPLAEIPHLAEWVGLPVKGEEGQRIQRLGPVTTDFHCSAGYASSPGH